MYPTLQTVRDYCENSENKKPVILCEYIHAMGNGPGDAEEYWQLVMQYPQLLRRVCLGMCDHAVLMGNTVDGKPIYGYGGDFGEVLHDSNFCMDGLVYPDRTPVDRPLLNTKTSSVGSRGSQSRRQLYLHQPAGFPVDR